MKRLRRSFARTIIWALVGIVALAAIPIPSQAMLAPATEEAAKAASDPGRTADIQTIQRVLENKLVQQRLEDLGLTPEEVNAKLNGLSDAQLHQAAAQIDALAPGGGLILLTLAIIIVVVIVLLIIII